MNQWQQDQVIAFAEGYRAARRGQTAGEIIAMSPLHLYHLKHEVLTGVMAYLFDQMTAIRS